MKRWISTTATLYVACAAFAAASMAQEPRKPLGVAADGHGLSPADVAQIRNAAGQLLCRTNNGRVMSSAWLMDAGRHILASLHSFFPGESERLAANPRDCHFIPSQDVKRRIALQAVQVADTARYLYIRNTPGAAPELVQRRTRLKKTPPDMEPIRAYDHWNFSPYRSTDYIVLTLGPNDLRASLEFDSFRVLERDTRLVLVSPVPISLQGKVRDDPLVVQECRLVETMDNLALNMAASVLGAPRVERTDCLAEPGMSGSILFRKKDGRLFAVGMLYAGGKSARIADVIVMDDNFVASLPRMRLFSDMSGDPEVLVSRGYVFAWRGKYDDAIADFTAALRLSPDSRLAYRRRADAHYRKGNHVQAIADYSEVLRLDPTDAAMLNSRCWSRAISGVDLNAALEDCNQSLRLRPRQSHVLDSRGLVHIKLGQYDRAIADYSQAEELKPNNASALYGRGYAKRRSGDIAGGDADMAAATKLDAKIADKYAAYGLR